MNNISEIKQDIDLVSVVESSGVELKQRETRHVDLPQTDLSRMSTSCLPVCLYERLNGTSKITHTQVWVSG